MRNTKVSDKNSVRFAEIIRISWGINGGLPEVWLETPTTSILTNKPPGKMHAPVRIRATLWGGIIVLANDPIYTSGEPVIAYHFSQKGGILGSVRIDPPAVIHSRWRIEDFLIDETGHLYLLETVYDSKGEYNHLRKLTSDGQQVWSWSGPLSAEHLDPSNLKGTFHQLLIDKKSTVYLAATQHRGLVLHIDEHNGSLEPYADWGEWTGEVYMDGEGKLYYVRYLPESEQRSWTSYDPQKQEEHVCPCDDSLYGLLAIPIAVDAEGRGYTAMDMQIACIDEGCSLLWQEHIDNIVVDERKGAIYTSTFTVSDSTAEIHVREWADSNGLKRETKLAVPPHLFVGHEGVWRLMHMDLEGRYYVYGGETPHEEGMQVVYSALGVPEGETVPTPDIHLREYRLQAARTWSVDLEGNVYLPLLGPTNFHIIKLSHL